MQLKKTNSARYPWESNFLLNLNGSYDSVYIFFHFIRVSYSSSKSNLISHQTLGPRADI